MNFRDLQSRGSQGRSSRRFVLLTRRSAAVAAVAVFIVGKRLCAEPLENHWKLRDYAAEPANDTRPSVANDTRPVAWLLCTGPSLLRHAKYVQPRVERFGYGGTVSFELLSS